MSNEFKCQEMVEVVTDYLDDSLTSDDRQRFERHLSYCAGCSTYVDQMRETIRQTGLVPREESLPPDLRERIVAQFRTWQEGEHARLEAELEDHAVHRPTDPDGEG
jgi:anti-sigma factor (TIGR02949 family)